MSNTARTPRLATQPDTTHPMKKARERLLWKPEFLAELAGVRAYDITETEGGRHTPTGSQRAALARALNVPQSRLFPNVAPTVTAPPASKPCPLQKAREAKLMTRAELAKAARVPEHAIADAEKRGTLPIGAHRYRLAVALGVAQKAIFPGAEPAGDAKPPNIQVLETPTPPELPVIYPANRAREIREAKGFSVNYVAARTGANEIEVQRFEEGRFFSAALLSRLSELFAVPHRTLCPGEYSANDQALYFV